MIEVLVALAIASLSLILVLSANSSSLRASVRARLDERIVRAAESKLAECRIGAEGGKEGPLGGFDRFRWEVRVKPETSIISAMLWRMDFRVLDPDGRPYLEWAILSDVQGGGR